MSRPQISRLSTPTLNTPYARTLRAASQPQNKSLQREKWAVIFGGPAYLEPGGTNRHVLALRSGIEGEIQWALERLVQVSGRDPELLRFTDYPGLLDGILDVLRVWVDQRISARSQRHDGSTDPRAVMGDKHREAQILRAKEAILILRNLVIENDLNLRVLLQSKKVTGVITDILDEGTCSCFDKDEMGELLVHALEILEPIARHVSLALPGYAIACDTTASPEPLDSPTVRLYPLLLKLTRSPDRALILGAFRCLTWLSTNDKNDPVLALVTHAEDSPHPHPIHTAIELLPLQDAQLSVVVLDYIYQHTLLPSNAVYFCANPELPAILKLVYAKIHYGAQIESVQVQVPMKGSDGEPLVKVTPPHGGIVPKELNPKMNEAELARLLQLNEPQRCLAWMRAAFEEDVDSEITQVALWTAYRTEFEPYAHIPSKGLLPAAEVIKASTEAFTSAVPTVYHEPTKKFIIKGIRVRDREDLLTTFKCHWQECSTPSGSHSQEAIKAHLLANHANKQNPPTRCRWKLCSYRSSDLITLVSHILTHLPSGVKHPATKLQPTPTTVRYHRYHAETDSQNHITGMGHLCSLVLRNVARTVKLGLGTTPGSAARVSLVSLQGEDSGEGLMQAMTRVFDSEGRIHDDSSDDLNKDKVVLKLEKVDYSIAKPGAVALKSLEPILVSSLMEDHLLGTLLAEAIGV